MGKRNSRDGKTWSAFGQPLSQHRLLHFHHASKLWTSLCPWITDRKPSNAQMPSGALGDGAGGGRRGEGRRGGGEGGGGDPVLPGTSFAFNVVVNTCPGGFQRQKCPASCISHRPRSPVQVDREDQRLQTPTQNTDTRSCCNPLRQIKEEERNGLRNRGGMTSRIP